MAKRASIFVILLALAGCWFFMRPQSPEQASTTDVQKRMDAQLQAVSSLPEWAAARDFHADVAAADLNVTVAGVICGASLCRVDIRVPSKGNRNLLARRLSDYLVMEGPIEFAYPKTNPSQLFAYVKQPESQLTVLVDPEAMGAAPNNPELVPNS